MQVSHSRIECFKSCPYRYDLKYNQGIKTISPDNADNALFLGTALHTGLEKDVDTAIKEYFMSYPIITDEHINEAIKLEYLIPKTKEILPKGQHEVKIEDDDFIGFIDLLTPSRTKQKLNGEYQVIPNVYDLYDFKYSNNVSKYKESSQLHLYKYFWEKNNPGKIIRNLYFLFVPKVNIKQKKTEDLFQFRKRILTELREIEPEIVQIDYNPEKVIEFMRDVKHCLEATEFLQNKNWLCNYCEYNTYCKKGDDTMLLPSIERRNISETKKRKLWIYGAAFSGKTTMLDASPNPLNLNTDGNIQFVTMPYISIKDEITVNGRMTSRKSAWEVFKDVIAELEKNQNEFKTIIVDLMEDTYEACRLYMYEQMGITHESDDSFKAWDKVRTEFLSTIKRLVNLNYENIVLISHEDTTKDIMKKSGNKITAIKPNIPDKIANKIAGMVDIVARVVVEDDDSRTLNFKQNEVIFGGGRLKGITETSIPLSWDALMNVYEQANQSATQEVVVTTEEPAEVEKEVPVEEPKVKAEEVPSEEPAEEPKARVRKRRGE